MNVLGVYSGFGVNQHDPGAALVRDGEVVCVAEEERFSRVKSARGLLPIRALRSCLAQGELRMQDIDLVVSPGEKSEHQQARIAAYLKHFFGHVPRIRLVNHQTAHNASAFFASGFAEAMCLSYDNSGDQLAAELAVGRDHSLSTVESIDNGNSLGRFYSMITQYLGFEAGEDEYKIMGLAPYGRPGVDLSDIVRPTAEGYRFNQAYFRTDPPVISVFEPWYSEKMIKLLGQPRLPGEPLGQREKDIAFAAQELLEACAISLTQHLHLKTRQQRLCIAGGIGLNCSANGKIRELPFLKGMFVQPAASDRGLPLGAALLGARELGERLKPIEDVYRCGPAYTPADIRKILDLSGLSYNEASDPAAQAAALLAQGKIIGWFQGRSEYGPRALGNRSILADPRSAAMKDEVNAKIKFREEFRPFAPAVLEEQESAFFSMKESSPFMTFALPVKEGARGKIPAVTHVNNTARVQSVSRRSNPMFHSLIEAFGRHTGVPVVLNTSFNVRGQPIVETPLDAIGTFAGSGLDALFIGPFVLRKRSAQ